MFAQRKSLVGVPRCIHNERWNWCRYCTRYEYRKNPFSPLGTLYVYEVAIPGEPFPPTSEAE